MNADGYRAERRKTADPFRELFEHQALLLADWADRIQLPDRARWDLVRLMDASHRRLRRRLAEPRSRQFSKSGRGIDHPAFRVFLSRLTSEGGFRVARPAQPTEGGRQ